MIKVEEGVCNGAVRAAGTVRHAVLSSSRAHVRKTFAWSCWKSFIRVEVVGSLMSR